MGPDLKHKHLSTKHGHCVEVAIADVGAILVRSLCGSGLGWGPWLGGLSGFPPGCGGWGGRGAGGLAVLAVGASQWGEAGWAVAYHLGSLQRGKD